MIKNTIGNLSPPAVKPLPLGRGGGQDKAVALKVGKAIFEEKGDQLPQPRSVIRKAIGMYVGHPKYLQTIISSEHRYDLEGNQVSPVDPKHKEVAKEKLERKQNSKRKERA